MPILELKIAPDPILSTRSDEVTLVNDDIRELINDMTETMYANDGAGLAANQVGVLKRVMIIDISRHNEPRNLMKFINPVFTYMSDEQQDLNDGCLSVPGFFYQHTRPRRVTMDYLDEFGQAQTIEADNLLSYALQHEVDHLDGKLFIEYLSPFKQRNIIRKLLKDRKINSRRERKL